jgi:tripartite-type tricarboxylate transporter receptor subunit TctC
MRTSIMLVAFGLLIAVSSTPVAAQYPNKPIRIVVSFPPGGSSDSVARILAQPLSQALGQPVIILNKPGADGAIAARMVMNSPPDGYTLFLGTGSAMVGVPILQKKPPYDPRADFSPISMIGRFTTFLHVHPSVPAKNVDEFIAHARSNPGVLNYGTGNVGAVLITAQLMKVAKINMVHVPYKGDSQAISDLLSGNIQVMFSNMSSFLGLAKQGKLRTLAVLSEKRHSLAPEIPTMAELGMPELSANSPWAGLFGPAKMPKELATKISQQVNLVLQQPDVKAQLSTQYFQAEGSTPDQLSFELGNKLKLWGRLAEEFGIKQE